MKNKNIVLWIFVVVVATGLSYGIVLSTKLYRQIVVNMKTKRVLKKQLISLDNYLRRVREKQKSLLELNKIIKQIKLKKLTPQDWFVYSIDEEARTSPEELKILLETVSKGRPYDSNFWFKPEEFAFLIKRRKQSNQNATSPLNYHFKLKGKFLFPKQGF